MKTRIPLGALAAAAAAALAVGCAQDTPTTPAATAPSEAVHPVPGKPQPAGEITGEHILGNLAIEPAYNADSGEMMFLGTPINAPLPAKANAKARSPLYVVEYPPGTVFDDPLNCAGVPGNCPDHAGDLAGFATATQSDVYGTDPTAVPGHDHVGDPQGAPDFNVAWEVKEVLFTPKAVTDNAITRLTTDEAIDAAEEAGYVMVYDLGFAFNCQVVPESLYWRGQPIG